MIKKFYSESVCTSHVPKQLRLEREKYLKTRNVSSIGGIKPKFWESSEHVKALLLQRFAFRKFHLIEAPNARDQIAFYVFH